MEGVSRRTVAYHEAGHAVAAFFLRHPIREVSIVPDGEALGRVSQHPMPRRIRRRIEGGDLTPAAERWLEEQAVITLAGAAAAGRLLGRKAWWRGARLTVPHSKFGQVVVGGDVHEAVDLLEHMAGDPEEASLLLELMTYRARRLIEGRWEFVQALAQALLQRGRLSGDEARTVIVDDILSRAPRAEAILGAAASSDQERLSG